MKRNTILPVSEALKEFALSEYLLTFYEDGLRGLIRDHVLVSTAIVCGIDFFEHEATVEDPLSKKITDSYTSSLFYRHDQEMGVSERNLNDALAASERIRRWINGMMYAILLNDVYSVQEQYFQWFGDDLIVRLDIWS